MNPLYRQYGLDPDYLSQAYQDARGDSGLNPQMSRPRQQFYMNPADYADEPQSAIGQAIDDYRAHKRDDTPAAIASGVANVATMPLKMMTLEGMAGLAHDVGRAVQTPYNVLTSPEPVTTEQMIEPAANIALTAPMAAAGAHAAGVKVAPREIVAANSKDAALPGLLRSAQAGEQLPMDTASRMKRAQEMGFDTGKTLYHGTGKDFTEFSPGTRGNGRQRNIYLTDNPEIADIYANSENYGLKGGGAPAIYPVYAKAEKPLIVSDKGPDGSFGWVSDNLAAALGVKHPPPGKYGSLYDEARRQGYDQVQIRDMTDLGGDQTQYIPLEAKNIRSVNAAFDPAQSHSPNLLASNPKEAALVSALAGEQMQQPGITAYHGSPHSFDRFSMDKIGTGEGAQAYGHGLYFAENEGVAKSYRDTVRNQWSSLDPETKPGHMYEVRINADPEHFLDWDKPLSQQSEKVRDFINAQPADEWMYHGSVEAEKSGHLPYSVMHQLKQPGASQALRDAGIPGIKYLDQGSRTAGEGSRNFVVFDDKLISIVRKYGWAGAAAMLGMSTDDLMSQAQAQQSPGVPASNPLYR